MADSTTPDANIHVAADGQAGVPTGSIPVSDTSTPTTAITVPPPNVAPNPAIAGATIPSAASITAQQAKPTPAENAQDTTLKSIASATDTPSLATEQISSENAAGIPTLTKTVNDLTVQLSGLNDQATKLQNDYNNTIPNQEQVNAEGRGITAAGLAPIQAGDLRRNQIQQGAIASQALTVKATLFAAQGNLTLAKDAADKAAQVKFDANQQELNYQKSLLDAIQPQLNREQTAKADTIKQELTDRQTQIDVAKANFSAVQDAVIAAAKAGASADTLTQMQTATTAAEAYKIAGSANVPLTAPGRYKDSITTTTDAFGNQNQTVRVFDTLTGQFVDNTNGKTAAQLNADAPNGGSIVPSNGSSTANPSASKTGTSGLPFQQYGLLANTNFNPKSSVDMLAQQYLQNLLQNGVVPTASVLGRGIKPAAFAAITQRARDLYFAATGTPMPNPEIIKGYQQQLIGNNKLLNNLNVQEGTIGKNAALLLNNVSINDINNNSPILNGIIDNAKNMLGDPNVAQFLAQNTTVSNELGSLLALKNAGGTTVHDKLEAAGIINPNDSPAQITAKVNVLLKEAVNAHDAIQSANSELYKQTDPLLQDANNPAREQMQNQPVVEEAFAKQGGSYDDFVAKTPAGQIPVLDKTTGQLGYIPANEFDATKLLKI